MKKILFILGWLLSVILVGLYTYENPEKIESLKNYFTKKIEPRLSVIEGQIYRKPANSFLIEFSKVLSISEKTAFVVHDKNILDFDETSLKIYTQNGYLVKNLKSNKLNLPKVFTTTKNGGVKNIFIYNNNEFALISSSKMGCFYASIVSLNNAEELFKTKCLPKEYVDYNGLGSSSIHHNNKIFLSIGTPEQRSSKIRALAQDNNSMFGKILEINKSDLDKIIANQESNLNLSIFTSGHRNPQGLTRINDSFFSVEHGPKGGDELNKIIKDNNYGWPTVSYGTQYFYDENGKAYEISHENNQFEEPLFALVPSVGISSLNTCPSILKNYYKKPCLLALSLYGNSLRPGKSIIIYLLNKKMNQVHSVEQVYLGDAISSYDKEDLKLRHFVTNSENELYEDKDGNIYVSADKKGIYKLSFVKFRD
tara:strand:- start:1384 stop:2655 length:1272 start_codon:yes stop_codon:yes gene_type:complete